MRAVAQKERRRPRPRRRRRRKEEQEGAGARPSGRGAWSNIQLAIYLIVLVFGVTGCEAIRDGPVGQFIAYAGSDIARFAEPLKIQWPRPVEGQPQEPATLVLRVEGPAALEIQHKSDVLLERVNRFFGWHAVGRLALRQAPLSRRERPARPRPPDPKEVAEVAKTLSAVEDEALKDALARLGAAIKRN